ncbi:MAG: hypothetical protein K2H45_08620 [Acetatifactor sp.]|nr:hypothetical protein [Acetatifactor sp.]
MEKIVRRQAEAILPKDNLYTKDVFFSQKAQEAEQNKENQQSFSGKPEKVYEIKWKGFFYRLVLASVLRVC